MRLFRGIAISRNKVDDVIENLRKTGMRAGNGRWNIMAPDLKKEFQKPAKWVELISKDTLSIDETRKKGAEIICACGDKESALYYACIHNKTVTNDTPVLIEFEAPMEDVWVDGRDFLYTMMQFWDRKTSSQRQKAKVKKILVEVFGEGIIPYLQECFKTCDSFRRVALVELAVNDHRVIEGFFKNESWIRGRQGTFFRSAFLVRSPILPSQTQSIQVVKTTFIKPAKFLDLPEILD